MPDTKTDKRSGADWSAVMPKQIVPAANLLTPPMGAMAAASVLTLGIASQMWGLWAGALAGVLDANTKLKPLAPAAKQAPDVAELKTIIRKKATETAPKAVAGKKAKLAVVSTGPSKPAAIAKPGLPDDLKRISGIGPKLEQVLNGLGIYTYAQIAAWSPRETAWVDDHLKFGGRIVRDEWVKQSAALAGVKPE
ncbi:helix-hairpin-helix domain-containing protein [Phyllobacterium myrsinacearum]|uniref:NADH-ubiquinone dehydrogenase n=1 Tax=Phyllobacterium myrsinacearum TaxID=28101 RepID=A0A2S9JD83_9HYPH|nr:helix-hairpin-helix domain-containing protein [Phyllobacterium myrsinacearum]PRD50855.1 NADH-ubiquinone dehydrogenase [Phyllobacterium myrsinacearum]PWV86107.1 putative flap endonuclease-1-like 5' DNA nuclease [Phyllobacterium myrsinacearum]RZU97745.1 NADH-quinone oxidoreductase subunit E [Phyllobacterium myrsinacearum]